MKELFGGEIVFPEGSGESQMDEDSCSELQFLDILCGHVMSEEIQGIAGRILCYYRNEVTEGYGDCQWLDDNMLSDLDHQFCSC